MFLDSRRDSLDPLPRSCLCPRNQAFLLQLALKAGQIGSGKPDILKMKLFVSVPGQVKSIRIANERAVAVAQAQ